jgi:hypothetical protein
VHPGRAVAQPLDEQPEFLAVERGAVIFGITIALCQLLTDSCAPECQLAVVLGGPDIDHDLGQPAVVTHLVNLCCLAVTGRVLYLYSERRAVKARNLAADPRVVVHLESGEDVVIVRGAAQDLGTPARSPMWSRPCRRNTPARTTAGICRTPTPISTWSMPSARSRQ